MDPQIESGRAESEPPVRFGQPEAGRLARRDGLALAAVLLLALALRLVYLAQVQDIPFVQHPVSDARAYTEWGRRIAAGEWWGSEAFYQAPLYPYFLAVVFSLFGDDLMTVHVIQMGLGALSCAVLYLATRALFGFAPALVAGLMLACYPPAIFFDGVLGKQGLGLLFVCALLGLLFRFQQRRRLVDCAGAGVVLGLLALTRENALAFVPALPLWIALRFPTAPWRARARWLAAFALGLALVLLPVGLRNYIVGDTFALTTSQMGTNFYIGNSEDATGLYVPLIAGRHTPVYEASDAQNLAEAALGRPLDRGEVSDYWLGRGLDFIAHNPGRWLELTLLKVALTWSAFEIADTEDLYVYAEWSPLLGALLPWLHFGVLVPLAVAGLLLAWERWRDLWLIGWLCLVYTGSVALFITFARFRYPLVPMLLPLSAFALVRAGALWRRGEGRALRGPALAVGVAAVLVNLPLVDEERFKLGGYANLGGIMLNEDRVVEAEPYLLRAMAIAEDDPDLRFHMGVLRYKQARWDDAERHLLRMIELDYDDFRGHRLLAKVYGKQGRAMEARREGRIAFQLNPDPEKRAKRRPRRPRAAPGSGGSAGAQEMRNGPPSIGPGPGLR